MLPNLENWFQQNKEKIFKDYFDLLKFKTISAEKNNSEMQKCAEWLSNYFKKFNVYSEVIKTDNYPLVYAEKIFDPKYETILIYGHFDVQPVDPIDEWKHPPFEPRIIDNVVYARGASDNKGQFFYSITALRALLELKSALKVNIKFILDSEEESESKSLLKSLDKIKDKIKADYLVVNDVGIRNILEPSITLGIRGLMAMNVEFYGSKINMHSGEHGGLLKNPIWGAIQVLAKLKDNSGRILVKGFYDDIIPFSIEEEKKISFEFNEEEYKKKFGIKNLPENTIKPRLKNAWLEPTLEINGIGGGYFKENFQTIIPAKVVVKISCRLVLNQDPKRIFNLLKDFLEKNTSKELDIKIEYYGGGKAVIASPSSKIAAAAQKAYAEIFKKPCKNILTGGSVPIVGEIKDKIKAEVVLIGTALDEDNIHAPNESFRVESFEKGFFTLATLLNNFAK